MADVMPFILATVGGLPTWRGFCERPPIVWHTVAEQWNAQSQTKTDGRYREDKKGMQGNAQLKRGDTSLNTGRNTGLVFVADSGTWADDWVNTQYNTYGLLIEDAAPGTVYQATTQANLSRAIEAAEITFGRGNPGISNSDANYNQSACYTYFTWGVGLTLQYQLRFVYGAPPSLWLSVDSGATFERTLSSRNIPNLESLLADNNNLLRLNAHMDAAERVFHVEIGNGQRITAGLPADQSGAMAEAAKFRITHTNGWLTFSYFAQRHQPIELEISKRRFDRALPLDEGRLVTNALTETPSDQSVAYTLVPEDSGQSVKAQVTASRTDAGDGKGSSQPPILTDAAIVFPSVYVNEVTGIADFRTANLAPVYVEERLSLNSVTGLYSGSAQFTCLNRTGELNDLIGSLYCELRGSNGIIPAVRRISGVTQSPRFTQRDPLRLCQISLDDMMVYLTEPIGERVILDGWCLWSAVRFVCDACGLAPLWLSHLPLYIPPGATAAAPYGPAGYDCPYYILRRGSGLNPKYEYQASAMGLGILQELLADLSEVDPITGQPASYVMGMDAEGYFRFQPFFVGELSPKATFSDLDSTGYGTLLEQVQIGVSTENVRTSLDLMGIDAFSREGLFVHQPGSVQARVIAGRPKKYIDQSPRYQDLTQMQDVARTMLVPASLPEVTMFGTTIYRPDLFPGDMVNVALDRFPQYSGLYIIEDMFSRNGFPSGSGFAVCDSQYRLRAAISYL